MGSQAGLFAARNQRGAVSAVAVLLLAIVVLLVLLMSMQISVTGVKDTLNQSDSVAALFLAESGLENAVKRLDSGAALCDATLAATASLGKGSFRVQAGLNTDYDGLTLLPANQCRVAVIGAITNSSVSRTIQAVVSVGSGTGAISLDNSSFQVRNNQSSANLNFATAGNDRLLLVGITVGSGQSVTGASYAGIALNPEGMADNGIVRVEIFSLVAPALGTNSLVVNVSAAARFVVGAASFNGVDQTTALEAANFFTGSGTSSSVALVVSTNNAWVFDTQGEFIGNTIPAADAGQTTLWNERTGGPAAVRVRGSGSYEGPVFPGNVAMNWSWTSPAVPWAIGAIAIRPSGAATGVLSWREVVQ